MANEYVAEHSKFTEVKAVAPEKAPLPILVTEAGMMMDVRPELLKASGLMLVS